MRQRRSLILALALLVALVLASCSNSGSNTPPQPTGSQVHRSVFGPSTGAWSIKCVNTKQLALVDPIVNPGGTAMHLHTFLGASLGGTGIKSTTTPADLHGAPGNMCPVSVQDPQSPSQMIPAYSSYWLPAPYYTPAKTTVAKPGLAYALIYYRTGGVDPALIKPFPQDLSMVGGDSHATQPQVDHVLFECIAGNDKSTPQSTIPDSCPMVNSSGQQYYLKGVVAFPNCITSQAALPNMTPAMAYAQPTPPGSRWPMACPANDGQGHPYTPIAQIEIEARFSLKGFPNDGKTYDIRGFTFASDLMYESYGRGTSYHGDFMSGWTTDEIADLTTNCLNAKVNCGAFGHGNQ